MTITEDELKHLIEVKSQIDKITTLSYDGKNLLTRVPSVVRNYLQLKKGDKFRWVVDNNNKINIENIKFKA